MTRMHLTAPVLALFALLTATKAGAAASTATGAVDNGMVAASLRMVAGLLLVLGLLALAAWLSRRFRLPGRLQGGSIEVLSGLSLGTREKVVLLRVGREQILVGVSPSGMRTLHVLAERAPVGFADQLGSQLETRP